MGRKITDSLGRLLLRLVRWAPEGLGLKLLAAGIRLRRLANGANG